MCATVDTGHTTAHLTMVTDTRLGELGATLRQAPRASGVDAGLAAINQIDDIVSEHDIDCSFEWVDGYRHAPASEADQGKSSEDDAKSFQQEATLARELTTDLWMCLSLAGRVCASRIRHGRHPRKSYLAGSGGGARERRPDL